MPNLAEEPNDLEYADTTLLLQAEIERLEAELAARDEALANAASAAPVHDDRRVRDLTSELALRDETIAQLWDHLRQREEAEAATQADWDDVQRLIEDLEARLSGGSPASPQEDRVRWEADRRAWDDQRAYLETEIDELRSRLSRAAREARSGEATTPARLVELEEENQRLRDQCRRLPQLEAVAAEVEDLRGRVKAAEAPTYSVTQSWPRQALAGSAPTGAASSLKPRLSAADLTPDERIRALRQHLREVHEKEQEERKSGQLKTRLGRLWRSIGG
jgi:predicted  nucleic acid-binding Zn-ribbon protein